MRILVLDGDNRAALAVTRSLGRAGHHVMVGERRTPSLSHASRYCNERITYPDPMRACAAFLDHLAELVHDRRIEILLPVSDVTTLLVTEGRHQFEPGCAVPFGPAEVLARAADKVDLVHTARQIGVPVPRSLVVSADEPVPEPEFGYPVVIKPRKSRLRTTSGWASSSVSYAADRASLISDLAARPRYEFPLLLQERLVGPGLGVFACYQRGRPVALFSHRRVRERPPWGGVSVLCESVPLDPVARDYAVRLLDELGWSGVAMVEFKLDQRDGIPKLMEINGRFWGSLQLAIDAGVDFPDVLVRSLKTAAIVPSSYRIGVRSRWLWGDIDSLLLVLVGRARTMGVPGSRWEAIADFMWTRGVKYENPRWDDLGPWWFETTERLRMPRMFRGNQVSKVTKNSAV